MTPLKFGLVVPTFNAGHLWEEWIEGLKGQTVQPDKLLVIDSSSKDCTVTLAQEAGFQVVIIPQKDFDHGRTRMEGVARLRDMDLIVFLTQDAILADKDSLKNIIGGFQRDELIAASYGRQLPHKDATPLAAHARFFNYPDTSQIKSKADVRDLGIKAAFCSNSFAAYKTKLLEECGGFPDSVVFGEDMCLAAKMLMSGYKVFYNADACVRHSHNYSILEEFRRYFDMGALFSQEKWLSNSFGRISGEGKKFVISEFKTVGFNPVMILSVIFRSGAKYAGYRAGLISPWLPKMVNRFLAMNKSYWMKSKA